MPHFFCAKCGQKIDADPSMAGVSLPCPACKYQLTVPPLGTIANRLPPLSQQPAATPTPSPWHAEPQPQPTPQLQQPSPRTRTRRASGNPRQLIIGTAAGILAFVGIFAGLNAWEKSKATTKAKPNPPPPVQAEAVSTPAPIKPAAPATVSEKPTTPPPAETPAPVSQNPTTPPPAEITVADSWITTDFHGLRLQLPGTPIPQKEPLPDDVAAQLVGRKEDSRKIENGKARVVITHATYLPEHIVEPRLKVGELASYLSGFPRLGDLTTKISDKAISGRRAAHLAMSYLMRDEPYRHHILNICEGDEYWQVTVIGSATEADALWTRVSGSLEFPAERHPPADEWITTNFHGLRLQLPSEPEEKTGDPDSESDPLVVKGGSHEAMLGADGCGIGLFHVTYKTTADLEGAVAEGLARVTSTPGGSGFETRTKKISISGRPAVIKDTSYVKAGDHLQQNFLTVTDGNDLWAVVILGFQTDVFAPWEQIVANASFGGKIGSPTPADPSDPPTGATPTADGWLTTHFHRLRLHLPGALVPTDMKPTPQFAEDLVGGTWRHAEVELEDYRFGIVHSVYKDGRAPDPTRMLDGSLEGKSQDADVTDLRSKRGEFTVSGRKAVFLEMSYLTEGIPEQHNALIIADGAETWFLSLLGEPELVSAGWKLITRHLQLQEKSAADNGKAAPAPRRSSAPEGWVTNTINGLTLDLPTSPRISQLMQAPPDVAEMLVGGKWDHCRFSRNGFEFNLVHSIYKADGEIDLRSVAEESSKGVSQIPGVTGLKTTIEETTVTGRKAIRGGLTYHHDGKPQLQNFLIISKGPEMWFLTTLGTPEKATAPAARIISGARFERNPTDTPLETASATDDSPPAPSPPANPPTEKEPAKAEWIATEFRGLKLKLPAVPQPEVSTAEDPRLVKGQSTFARLQHGSVSIGLYYMKYKDGSIPAYSEIADGAIKAIAGDATVKNLTTRRRNAEVSGRQAYAVEMSYEVNGIPCQQNVLIILRDGENWLIDVTGRAEEVPAPWKLVLTNTAFK